MDCNITIDQGNTAAKAALWDIRTAQCVAQATFRPLTAADLDAFCAGHHIVDAIYSSVSGVSADITAHLGAICADVTILTDATPTPLVIDYRSPRTLGVDRLAAAVGAASLPETSGCGILIADIGTACTYDFVSADRHYRGGNIAPGIYMRLQALNHYTARLPLVEPTADPALWGDDTESALRSGAVNGVIAELAYYYSGMEAGSCVVITGGAADLVLPSLDFPYIYIDNLVSLGLNSIIRYNTAKSFSNA